MWITVFRIQYVIGTNFTFSAINKQELIVFFQLSQTSIALPDIIYGDPFLLGQIRSYLLTIYRTHSNLSSIVEPKQLQKLYPFLQVERQQRAKWGEEVSSSSFLSPIKFRVNLRVYKLPKLTIIINYVSCRLCRC